MTRNETVYSMAQDWIRWLDTRRLFGEPPQRGILAMLVKDEPKPSTGEPDAELSSEMAAFNMAVSSLEIGKFVPFVVVYCDYRPKPVKALAAEFGIERCQFYERAHIAASEALSITRKLVRLSQDMRDEVMEFELEAYSQG